MRKFNPVPKNQLPAALAVSLRRVGGALCIGWALTSLGFCGVIAVALL